MSHAGAGGVVLGFPPLPPVVKKLLIVLAAAFVVQSLARLPTGGLTVLERYGALTPAQFGAGMIWQPLTRLFLHAEFSHLAGNLFALYLFGGALAEAWGARRFLLLFVGGGAAGGVLQGLGTLGLAALGLPAAELAAAQPSLGASGAVFTLMTVFSLAHPRRVIGLLFVPLAFEARWLVPILVGLELGFPAPGISHGAHLLGVLVGAIAVLLWGGDGSKRSASTTSRRGPPRRPGHLRVVGGDGEPPLVH